VEGVDEGGAKEGEAAMERGTRSVRGHHTTTFIMRRILA